MYVVNDISNLTAENFPKSGIQTDAKETRDNAMNGNVIKNTNEAHVSQIHSNVNTFFEKKEFLQQIYRVLLKHIDIKIG